MYIVQSVILEIKSQLEVRSIVCNTAFFETFELCILFLKNILTSYSCQKIKKSPDQKSRVNKINQFQEYSFYQNSFLQFQK